MNPAKQAAKRVYKYAKGILQIPQLLDERNISVERIQAVIEETRALTGMSEEKIADGMIQLFKESWKNLKE